MPSTKIRELLAEHEQSDLSLAAFAREKGVPPHRLYEARRRARLKERKAAMRSPSPFQEVALVDVPVSSTARPIDLRLPSGLSLRLERDFDEVTLRRVLGVLASC